MCFKKHKNELTKSFKAKLVFFYRDNACQELLKAICKPLNAVFQSNLGFITGDGFRMYHCLWESWVAFRKHKALLWFWVFWVFFLSIGQLFTGQGPKTVWPLKMNIFILKIVCSTNVEHNAEACKIRRLLPFAHVRMLCGGLFMLFVVICKYCIYMHCIIYSCFFI